MDIGVVLGPGQNSALCGRRRSRRRERGSFGAGSAPIDPDSPEAWRYQFPEGRRFAARLKTVVSARPAEANAWGRLCKQGPGRLLLLRLLLSLSLSFFALSCSRWNGESEYHPPKRLFSSGGHARATSFGVGLPGRGWKPYPEDESGLQVAWFHSKSSSVIQVRSQCAEHGDSSLEMFTEHIGADFEDWELLQRDSGKVDRRGRPIMQVQQSEFKLADRRAVRSSIQAKLDGVKIRLEIVVVKKNGCLFDLMYISRPDDFEKRLPAFERVVAGFRFPLREGGARA